MKIMNKLNIKIILHPKSLEDIKKDRNEERREITISKFKTYDLLESFPNPEKDSEFINIVGIPIKLNDVIDNFLLYTVYKNAVNFIITEDLGILKKANKLGVSERVLSVLDAINLLIKELPKEKVKHPIALENIELFNLNINDPFFNSLRNDYPKFNEWFIEKSKKGRKCFVYRNIDDSIGAILIYKLEDEEIHSNPKLPKKKRLKICTLKVISLGFKIGELFIKIAIELAINNNRSEIYFTHFTKDIDYLVDLIEEYGFQKVAIFERNNKEEDVFLKKILIKKEEIGSIKPLEVLKKYFSNFYDGIKVKKFIVPIKPIYHDKLFTDFPKRQTTINEHLKKFIIEGNTIKKAYLCNASTKKIRAGHLLLFYRSEDEKAIVSLGVVEKVKYNLRNKDKIANLVGKRTVYSISEIEEISKKPTIVILFIQHFHFKKLISYEILKNNKILRGPPQTITEIKHNKYLIIKKKGGIDERFTFN